MTRKPLPELLKQIDSVLGIEKKASAVVSDEVFALADVLSSAESIQGSTNSPEFADFEKVAIALNRVVAANQIREMQKLSSFTKKAKAEGYSEEQVEEAIQKVASTHLKKNIGLLSAIGAAGLHTEDKNTLEKRPVKAGSSGEASRRLPLTRSAGGSR